MASTRAPGITTSIDGRRFIDKRYRGIRIGMRVGGITQESAELRLHAEMVRTILNRSARSYRRVTRAASRMPASRYRVRAPLRH